MECRANLFYRNWLSKEIEVITSCEKKRIYQYHFEDLIETCPSSGITGNVFLKIKRANRKKNIFTFGLAFNCSRYHHAEHVSSIFLRYLVELELTQDLGYGFCLSTEIFKKKKKKGNQPMSRELHNNADP